jgi:hypothetical protein
MSPQAPRTPTARKTWAGHGGTPLVHEKENKMRGCATGLFFALTLFAANGQAAERNFSDCYNNCLETCAKVAPNVTSYCEKNNLNCSTILAKVIDTKVSSPLEGGTYIGTHDSWDFQSPKCQKEERTYFRSVSPLVYQMVQISEKQFLVLYSKDRPDVILKSRRSRWNLVILDIEGKIIDNKKFTTNWKYDNNELEIWSMIDTSLNMKSQNDAIVKISYTNTGSYPHDQIFVATVKVAKSKLTSIKVKQVLDNLK